MSAWLGGVGGGKHSATTVAGVLWGLVRRWWYRGTGLQLQWWRRESTAVVELVHEVLPLTLKGYSGGGGGRRR